MIRNQGELDNLIQQLWQAEHIGVAISNSSPPGAGQQQSTHDGHAQGIAFAPNAGRSAFVDFENFAEGKEAALQAMRELLSNGLIEKSVHDLKRATALLSPHGIELAGVTDDTLIAAYVIDPTRSKYELTDLARETVGAESGGPPYDGWCETGWQTAEVGELSAQVARVFGER